MLSYGNYPDVTLQEAREMRDADKKVLAAGNDPALMRKKEKLEVAINRQVTFEAVAREWLEINNEGWTERHAGYVKRRIERNLFPRIGNLPIVDITPPMVLDCLRAVEKRGGRELSHRLLQSCGQIYRFAIQTGRAKYNPTADLKGALRPHRQESFAAIGLKELPHFLHELDSNRARMYPLTQDAMRLMLYTFVRTIELISAQVDEFDFDRGLWVIPAKKMKMRREHVVPMSEQVAAIFKRIIREYGFKGDDYIFPNVIRSGSHMSNNTLLRAIDNMGYKGSMTGHGFRALASTILQENLKYQSEVVHMQLAHVPKSKVHRAYDRMTFIDERRVMMQKWADFIDGLPRIPKAAT